MIWNPGQLPPDWTVKNLLGKHSSQPYNPEVANAFFRAGMIESWGRGIERIMAACKAGNVPEPELRYEHTGLWTVFYYTPKQPEVEEVVGGVTQETTQEKILVLLKSQPKMTRKALAEKIGMSPDGIKYHLEKMRAAGIIRHVGSTKAGHWEVLK
jgi:ATP-dependent DNA helicase RecG